MSGDYTSFSSVAVDRLLQAERRQIVHESGLCAQTPKGRGTKFRRGFRRTTLDDMVAGPYIV